VDHLWARLRARTNGLDASRWHSIRDFLVPWRPGDRSEVLRLDDPKPFVLETIEWFRGR
jgi:hypothetical protein